MPPILAIQVRLWEGAKGPGAANFKISGHALDHADSWLNRSPAPATAQSSISPSSSPSGRRPRDAQRCISRNRRVDCRLVASACPGTGGKTQFKNRRLYIVLRRAENPSQPQQNRHRGIGFLGETRPNRCIEDIRGLFASAFHEESRLRNHARRSPAPCRFQRYIAGFPRANDRYDAGYTDHRG
jgi:hypothetical protein